MAGSKHDKNCVMDFGFLVCSAGVKFDPDTDTDPDPDPELLLPTHRLLGTVGAASGRYGL